MSYLIDSDWVIDYLSGRPAAGNLIDRLAESGIAISLLTYREVVEGLRGSHEPTTADQVLHRFLEATPIYGIGPSVAEMAANIRIELRRQRRQVNHRALDILIAATAIEHDLTLVTRNTRDYDDIPGLRLYDLTE